MGIESLKWFDHIISDVLDSVYTSLNERLDRAIKAKKIPDLRDRYLDALFERIRYINLPQIGAPRKLSDIFVELYVFRSARRWQATPDHIPPSDISISHLLSDHRQLLVLGEPGAGKTTFVRHILNSICNHNEQSYPGLERSLFPILVECRHHEIPSVFAEYDDRAKTHRDAMKQLEEGSSENLQPLRRLKPPPEPLVMLIATELGRFGFPYAENFIQELLRDGRVIIFIDGLDEAPAAQRNRIVKSLEALRSNHPLLRMVATSRTAEAELVPSGFAQYEIAPLNVVQREAFIQKWFASEAEAARFLAKVQTTHIWGISDRPILLALLCALYQAGGDLPRYKVDLYRECAELALRRWDTFRSIKRETAFDLLSLNQRLNILARIGATMTRSAITIIEVSTLDSWFYSAMEENGIEGDPVELREEIVSHSGLLVQVSLSRFSFSHKSLQDYFAALHFSRSDFLEPVANLRTDRQWLATVEMTACMVSDAGKIILWLVPDQESAPPSLAKDLEISIRIISENPVTIATSSRNSLIERMIDLVDSLRLNISHVVLAWRYRFEAFDTNKIASADWVNTQLLDSEFLVYISHNSSRVLSLGEIQVVGLASVLIFRLLGPARSWIPALLKRFQQSWVQSLLFSIALHGDMDSESTLGRQIASGLIPNK